MFKRILTVIAIIILGFVVAVAMQPNHFRVTRTTTINASPSAVFAQVNDLHNWQAWSPWAKLDPNVKNTFEGPPDGTGAVFNWAGNNNVGEGRMTIVESRPNEMVRFKLEFFKPFAGTNTAEFTFQGQGAQTVVTWSMYGPQSFMGKAMGLVMNCDKFMGAQFEQGLTNLNSVVEAGKK